VSPKTERAPLTEQQQRQLAQVRQLHDAAEKLRKALDVNPDGPWCGSIKDLVEECERVKDRIGQYAEHGW
jgi:hypothetical protein